MERKRGVPLARDEAVGMDSQIQLGDRLWSYQIRRSRRRRTIAIAMDSHDGLVVYSPQRVSVEGLQEFLRDKARWILSNAKKLEEARARAPLVTWEAGSEIPWRGGRLVLRIVPGAARGRVALEGGELVVHTTPEDGLVPDAERIRARVVKWLRQEAAVAVGASVEAFQSRVGLEPRRVRIREQKRRWGSCSASGALNFNWRLILAPAEGLDYVVVHELCHLRELNHSPRFWEWVGQVMPDFAAPRAWLRQNGMLLDL
jgi:predicted metal-dependent hydrolase